MDLVVFGKGVQSFVANGQGFLGVVGIFQGEQESVQFFLRHGGEVAQCSCTGDHTIFGGGGVVV